MAMAARSADRCGVPCDQLTPKNIPLGSPPARGSNLRGVFGIGPLEIVIVLVIILLIFGARHLPTIGRKAGTGARELKESAQELAGDKLDPKNLGRTAGEGLREAREFRDVVTGKAPAQPAERKEPAPPPEPAGDDGGPTKPAERPPDSTAAGPGTAA